MTLTDGHPSSYRKLYGGTISLVYPWPLHPARPSASIIEKIQEKHKPCKKRKGLDDTMEPSLCCCCFDIYNVCLVSFNFSVPVTSRHSTFDGRLQSTPIQTLQDTHLRFNPYHRDLLFHNMHLSPPIVVEQELYIAT